MPRATFDQCAPQRLREQATLSKHNQQLARLEFELEQRKELATKLKQKKAQVERLRIELADRRDAVIDVEPGLVALVESTKPLLQGLELELSTMGESIHFDEYVPYTPVSYPLQNRSNLGSRHPFRIQWLQFSDSVKCANKTVKTSLRESRAIRLLSH